MRELPVIAAGSLLGFALADHEFSMPVGRISYMYLEPLSFEEFLVAIGQEKLKTYLQKFSLDQEIPNAIHQKLITFLKEYLLIGGMPAAVLSWVNQKNLSAINQIHIDLLSTYRDDFAKYRGRLPIDYLEDILSSIPRQLGGKFVYSQANSHVGSTNLKQALDLIVKARIGHQVFSTAANGLPLDAEIKERFFKVILLDCGLINSTLGLSLHQLSSISELILINSGAVAEQLVGQQLRTNFPSFSSPSLYYWHRAEKSSNAEIDYVIQHNHYIIPIEVKAGTTGSLKSLHLFMKEKQSKLAIRINSGQPSFTPVHVKTSHGSNVEYNLLSIPFYLIGQLPRLLDNLQEQLEATKY